MKCRGSSETRFPKVWGRKEPSSGGKWLFKVLSKIRFFSMLSMLKNEMLGIVWNAFSQSLRPNGVMFEGETSVQSFAFLKNAKLWTAVYPPRMAPFGLKLWENAFRMIPDISFFDVPKFCWVGKSANCLLLRSCGFLDVTGRCASRNGPRCFVFRSLWSMAEG